MRPPFGYGETVQVTVAGAVAAPLLAVAETTFPVQDLTFFTKSQVKRIRDTSAAKAPVTMIWAPRGYPVAAGILAIGNATGGVNCQAVPSNTPLWLPSASFKITREPGLGVAPVSLLREVITGTPRSSSKRNIVLSPYGTLPLI